ncbi:hypothetical protein [Paenibacillus sp. 481]|uniref:hypothetical protein n=1 Tax=Paenibacillus sp. 481 TaxID=2835869 RepID=UPI001E424A72|nr:hypothetical protein [Paenibacillus sp. 481]UHA75078.1 hypothetical protein KIK04_08675 [Paenibacillus sp. 481]
MKSYRLFLTTLTVTGLLLSTVPLYATNVSAASKQTASQEVETMTERESEHNELTISHIDAHVKDAALQAIREIAPNKVVELNEVVLLPDNRYVIYSKEKDVDVTVEQSGKVRSVNVQFKLHEVDPSLMDMVKGHLQQMDAKRTYTFDKITRSKAHFSNTDRYSFMGNNKLFVEVNAKSNLITYVSTEYAVNGVEKSALDTAKTAIKQFSGKDVAFDKALRVQVGSVDLWKLYDLKADYVVNIEANMGNVVSILAKNKYIAPKQGQTKKDVFAVPFYSSEQAINAANSMVQQLFNVQLSGTSVDVKLDMYTFTKQGQPSIRGVINSKGEFWQFKMLETR